MRYIFKGNDRGRVVTETAGAEEINECKNYIDGRYIGAQEALWRNYSFYVYGLIICINMILFKEYNSPSMEINHQT